MSRALVEGLLNHKALDPAISLALPPAPVRLAVKPPDPQSTSASAFGGKSLRQEFNRKSENFALVDKVAHAFKHVQAGRRNAPALRAKSVITRPPAVAGVMRMGLSRMGDNIGSVTLIDDTSINLLEVVKKAVLFLRCQTLS